MSFEIKFTPTFKKELNKLPLHVQELSIAKGKIFIASPFDQSLDSHKLNGKLKEYYSFSINYKFRVIFSIHGSIIYLESIGTHSIYDRFR